MSFLREVQLEKEFGPSVVFREALGFLPNLIRAQSLLPRVIEAQAKLEDAVRLRAGDLSRAQKERILLTIAADRRDSYCIAMHGESCLRWGRRPVKSMIFVESPSPSLRGSRVYETNSSIGIRIGPTRL